MTNLEILTKAIQKAIDGGWVPKTPDDETMDLPLKTAQDVIEYWDLDWKEMDWPDTYCHIIFNHDFAKALWGEELDYCMACERSHSCSADCDMGCGNCTQGWKFHLMLMVIAEDPIKYLGENIS